MCTNGINGLVLVNYDDSDEDEEAFTELKPSESKQEPETLVDVVIVNHKQEALTELPSESECKHDPKTLTDVVIDNHNQEAVPALPLPSSECKSDLQDSEILADVVIVNYDKEAFTELRPGHKQDPETSDSDSDSSTEEDDTDTLSESDEENLKIAKKRNGPRVKGEQRVCDLPPIEDLHISVPHEECKPIGVVKSFVDPLVIVAGDVGSPALDLDSVLFLDEGDRALGKIFDVFGPVKEPHYCVRFNSKDHIDSMGIKCGMIVYCAPETPHCSFVFLAQIRRYRGTDASWKDDIEPPNEEQDYSDDEMEEFAKSGGRRHIQGRGRGAVVNSTVRKFVTSMGSANNSDFNASRGRKRNYNNTGPIPVVINNTLEANPFVPPNVPGFRVHRPFHRGRGRGFPAPMRGYGQYDRFCAPRFPYHSPNNPSSFSMNSCNDPQSQYWSSYWKNFYESANPNHPPVPPPPPFYQNRPVEERPFRPPPPLPPYRPMHSVAPFIGPHAQYKRFQFQ